MPRYGQSNKATTAPSNAPSTAAARYQPRPPALTLFNAPLQPRPINQPVVQPINQPVQLVGLDPATYLLFAAMLEELRKRNEIEQKRTEIELIKLKMTMVAQHEEEEAAKHAKEEEEQHQKEDEQHFSEIKGTLYM